MLCNDVDKDIEATLWEHEKNWQSKFFTNICSMNSVSDLYSRKRKGGNKEKEEENNIFK